MSNYYVTKKQDGTWKALKENASKASGVFDTQRQAEKEAKRLSHNSGGGEVRIQDKTGKFRDSDTVPPGKDSFPPRDRKY